MINQEKLAIAPINWSNDDDHSLGGDISFEQCISDMHQAGYKGTEIGHKYPDSAPALLAALNSQQLRVSSAWFSTFFTDTGGYEKTLQQFMARLSFLRAVGAEVINVCECTGSIQQQNLPVFSSAKPVFSQPQWQLLIDGLHDLGRLASDYGIKLSYHYHLGTGVQNKDEIDYLMAHTAPALLGLLLDTGHARAAGVDISDLLDTYINRINQVHLKDVREGQLRTAELEQWSFMQAVRRGLFTVPGDGSIDFAPIISRLNRVDYKGWWVVEAEQDPKLAPPLDYARKAYHYLTELFSHQ